MPRKAHPNSYHKDVMVEDVARDTPRKLRPFESKDVSHSNSSSQTNIAVDDLEDSLHDLIVSGKLHSAKDESTANDVSHSIPRSSHRRSPIALAKDLSFDVSRRVKMVLWTDFAPFSVEWSAQKAPDCDIWSPYLVNHSKSMHSDYDISDADVVVINLAELERYYSLPRHKREGQLWVATCWEPKRFGGGVNVDAEAGGGDKDGKRDMMGDCSLLDSAETMSWFDAVASYDTGSDFPALFTPPPEDVLRRPAPDFDERGGELATLAINDCRYEWRNHFVRSVNATLVDRQLTGSILSYGDCMHNAEEAKCERPTSVSDMFDGEQHFSNRCASRPFQIVAENTDAPWYVTEKIWNALASGAVPVYLGSDDAKKLVPPNSTIFASDYASTDALVNDLLLEYERGLTRFHAWKQAPTSSWGGWSYARGLSRGTLPVRLCAAAAKRQTLSPLEPGELGRENKNPTVDPERNRSGTGFPGAMRRALEGLSTAGSQEATDLLAQAQATKQKTGVWPLVTPPPYEEALPGASLAVAAQANASSKDVAAWPDERRAGNSTDAAGGPLHLEKSQSISSSDDRPASTSGEQGAIGEHEENVEAMSTLWSRITSGD